MASEHLGFYERTLQLFLSDALDAVDEYSRIEPPCDGDSEKWVEMRYKEAYEDYDTAMRDIEKTRRMLVNVQSSEDRAIGATEQQVVIGLPHTAANENPVERHQLMPEAMHNNQHQQPRSSSVQLTSCTPLKGETASGRLQVSTGQQVASQQKSSMEDVCVYKGASLACSMSKERLHISQLRRSVVPVNGLHLRVRRRLACSVRSSWGTKCHRKVKGLVN